MTTRLKPKKLKLKKLKLTKPLKRRRQDLVIGGARREKFHKPDCTYASYLTGSNRIEFENPMEARAAGLIPCRICLGYTI
jgi:hypothetical protein